MSEMRSHPRELEPIENMSSSMSTYLNPNLVKSLHFNSPGATARDRFSTTNVGYTTAIKFKPKADYHQKLLEEKEHRARMREIILGTKFDLGFDSK
jgi:hypothetical protein